MAYNKIPLALAFDPISGNTSGLVEFYFQLSDVANMCDTSPNDGEVLVFTGGEWCPGVNTATAGASALSALFDICPAVTGVSENQVLAWNGSFWCPSTIATGGGGGLTPVGTNQIYFNSTTGTVVPVATNLTTAITTAGYNISTGTTYVEPSELSNYVTVTGTNVITGSNTFNQSPIISTATENTYAYFNGGSSLTSFTGTPNNILSFGAGGATGSLPTTAGSIAFLNTNATLSSLADTSDLNGAGDGQVIAWNLSEGSWSAVDAVTGAGGGGSTTFTGLTDVTLTGSFTPNYLIYAESATGLNSTSATANSLAFLGTNANLSDCTDVSVGGDSGDIATGDLLSWSGSPTNSWVPTRIASRADNSVVDGVVQIEFEAYLSVPDNATGKGDLTDVGILYVSGTSSTDTAFLPYTDFSFNFISGASPVLEDAVQSLYLSGDSGLDVAAATANVYKTFLSIDSAGSQMDFVGPVEVSATAPASETGKIWLDTSETASGIDVMAVTTITESYSALLSDNVVLADCTASSLSATLPTAVTKIGKIYNIKKLSTANNLYVVANGSETIDGDPYYIIGQQYNSITVVTDGSNWHIL